MSTHERIFEQGIGHMLAGDYPAARLAIQETMQGLRGPSAHSLTAWGLYYLGVLYRERGQGFRAFKLLTDALHRHHALHDPSGQGWAMHAIGTMVTQGDHWMQAVPLFRKAGTSGQHASDAALIVAALNEMSRAALLEGRLQKAQQLLAAMVFPLASTMGFSARRTTTQVTLTWGRLALGLGDGEMAAAYARQSQTLARRWDDHAVEPEVELLLAESALQRHVIDAAASHAHMALAQSRRFGQRLTEAEALLLTGRIAMSGDRLPDAQAVLGEASRLAKRLGSRLLRLRVLASLALMCERSRQSADALAHARRVLRLLAPRELPQLHGAMHALGRRLAVDPEEQALWKREGDGNPRSLPRVAWLPLELEAAHGTGPKESPCQAPTS